MRRDSNRDYFDILLVINEYYRIDAISDSGGLGMQRVNTPTILFLSILVIPFLMVIFPTLGVSQPATLGCCYDSDANECVGCVGDCSLSEELCGSNSWYVNGDEGYKCVLVPPDQIQSCEPAFGPGCCVYSERDCSDDVDFSACNGAGEAWFEQESCSNVPQCLQPVQAPIPALTEWGFVALGGILVLAGIYAIRRRKAHT